MSGTARLYHATLQFDLSYTALDGTGDSLKGGSLPVPSVDPADLVLFDDLDGVVLQPRPGTMPGLYLYYDDAEESYYHYGSPLESGANPQSTAVYAPSEGEGLGGTIIRTNNLSGAQLWYYGAATPPYIEIKHVDGSIAHFEPIDPYRTSYSTPGQLWRVKNVRDPYDNVATYNYDSAFRLIRIDFPSGLKQIFDYAPSWGTWSIGDRFEVRYTQTSGTTTTNLTDLTWGIVFYGTSGSSGGWHFGKRLYRTYSASRQILKEVSAG